MNKNLESPWPNKRFFHFFHSLRSLKTPLVTGHTQPGALCKVAGEHHRFRSHAELLYGHDAAEHAGPEVR